MPKIIVMFGGVYSSLGKGIAQSSIAKILTSLGYSVSMMKMDPYLNVDPGTMAPGQHGEVYVTNDGAQADLDLGNYERFLGKDLSGKSTLTSGKVYWHILTKERAGGFKGKTVQLIPTVTDSIKEYVFELIEHDKPDFLLIEVGGTIGDLEGVSFIEAISQLTNDVGPKNLLSALLSPLISLSSTSGEHKTKPTQHAIALLRGSGVNPNMLLLRSSRKIDKSTVDKLSLITHMPADGIFQAPDVKLIYELPLRFYEQGIHKYILKYFGMKYIPEKDEFKKWVSFIKGVKSLKTTKTIALLGKYTDLHDAYASLMESIKFAGWKHHVKVKIKWIEVDQYKKGDWKKVLKGCDGAIVPGGFGERGTKQIIQAYEYLRTHKIPTIGLCLGMQLMGIEYARNVLGMKDANSTEFDPKTPFPIVEMMDGELRLGAKKCAIEPNTLASKVYKKSSIMERHRHRYAIYKPEIVMKLRSGGLIPSMISDQKGKQVVEFLELPGHICYMACQYHPEFLSRPTDPEPLFDHLLDVICNKKS